MHLYVHEFNQTEDVRSREIKNLIFKNSLKDYGARTGEKFEDLKIETTKHGKPFFPGASNIHFSVSHSGRYWVCIFDEENIGIDIEDYSSRNMSVDRLINISDRFYKSDEKKYVLGDYKKICSGDDCEELKKRFFKIWTGKEAYMKYTGNGFTEGFKNFTVLGNSLNLNFKTVPIDPQAVLTFCSKHNANLDELINF